MDHQSRNFLLMHGIRQLREAAGEEMTTKLIRSNVDVRAETWGELMRSGDPLIHEALANILGGLGLDPDDMTEEAST